jgi:hypothetical protein
MKNHIIIICLGFCLLFSSCVTVSYLGDKLPPTTSVDVYYSAHDVTKAYKVIGHLTCPNAGTDYDKKMLSSYAQKIGADAIVITGTDATKNDQAAVVNADALKYN